MAYEFQFNSTASGTVSCSTLTTYKVGAATSWTGASVDPVQRTVSITNNGTTAIVYVKVYLDMTLNAVPPGGVLIGSFGTATLPTLTSTDYQVKIVGGATVSLTVPKNCTVALITDTNATPVCAVVYDEVVLVG